MTKTSALRIRIEPDLHQKFLAACQEQDIPAAQVLRKFMREFVMNHASTLQTDLFERSPNA